MIVLIELEAHQKGKLMVASIGLVLKRVAVDCIACEVEPLVPELCLHHLEV